MNAKNTKKSHIHENADANITCDFGDGDISRSRSRFTHTHGQADRRIASSIIVRCILDNGRIIVHNMLCCCHKYHVLSNLVLVHLISSAIVDDLVMIYFFSFDLYTT